MFHTSTLPSVPSLRPCCHRPHVLKVSAIRLQASRLIRCSAEQPKDTIRRARPLAVGLAALVAAGLTHFSPPAYAEIETVSAASATTMAKPLKEQKVDKEKVWLIFILGAAGLFGGTLLLENNERFFPAIYKANLAMSQAKKAVKAKEKVAEAIDVDGGERVQSAVEAGLLEASRRRTSEQETSISSSSAASEQQQESRSSSAAPKDELQESSDEQLQAAIQQLRAQKERSDHEHSEGSRGSEQTDVSPVIAESPNNRHS